MIDMADNLLIGMIIVGFGLSGVYFRAAFVSWRRNQAAERKREIRMRELGSSVERAEKSIDAEAAKHEAIAEGDVRPDWQSAIGGQHQ
jgi:hypothetical protein